MAFGLSAVIGMFISEMLLRWRLAAVARSDQLDAGLVQYDPALGWQLTPGWTGSHRHRDFVARYSVSAAGVRGDGIAPEPGKKVDLTMFVGDSFTFGLGVNDDETFVHHLQRQASSGGSAAPPAESRDPRTTFMNAAVPGYSTDQQVLLIERRLTLSRPARIVLVVYLGNDLFDNLRAVPMQVRSRKPRFELRGDALVLSEPHVSLADVPPPEATLGLLHAVRGEDPSKWSWRGRWEARSELFRLASSSLLPAEDLRSEFPSRFRPAVRLFDALIQRLAAHCARHGIELVIAPLGGPSHAADPESVSGQFQEYLRGEVVRAADERGLAVIDLAAHLRAGRQGAAMFFPHDGHLTPAGHAQVARILAEGLATRHAAP